ncbi:MAG: hypothetical protein MRY59_13530 [Aquisalinus sp.]|nr:hypothetical protein [Aquisalinus sp.]
MMQYFYVLLQAAAQFSAKNIHTHKNPILSALLFLFVAYGSVALVTSPNSYHVDGQYQLLSTAVLAGSDAVLGRDYVLYLGIIPGKFLSLFTWLEAGWFVLLCAFISGLGWMIVTRLAASALQVPRERIWLVSLLALVVFFLFCAFYMTERKLFIPDNSALSYRFVFSAGLFLLLSLLITRKQLPYLSLGLCIALMPLLSFDFGVPIGASAGLYVAIKQWRAPLDVAKTGVTALILFFGLLGLFTQFHYVDFFERYQAVSDGQLWYFGSYTDKIFDLQSLLASLGDRISQTPQYWIMACLVLLITRRLVFALISVALIMAAILLETVGHRSDRYYYPFYAFNALLLFIVAINFITAHLSKILESRRGAAQVYQPALAIMIMALAMTMSAEDFNKKRVQLQQQDRTYAGFISEDLKNYLAPLEGKVRLVGDYYSPAVHVYGGEVHTSSALAIHALGERNYSAWLNFLTGADDVRVLTTNPEYTYWQMWSVMQQFWFFDAVLVHFRPVMADQQHIVWQPRDEIASWSGVREECVIEDSRGTSRVSISFDLPVTSEVYKAILAPTYSGQHALWLLRWRNGKMMRGRNWQEFGASAQVSELSFLLTGGKSEVQLEAVRGRGGTAQITSCRIEVLKDSDAGAVFPKQVLANMQRSESDQPDAHSAATSPLDFTDQNWKNGILTINKRAVILVGSDDILAPFYQQGAVLEFTSGETRVIESVRQSTRYIELWLDGPKLDPATHGAPNRFRLVNP